MRLILVGALALAGAVALSGCGKQGGPPPKMPPQQVGVLTIAEQPVPLRVPLTALQRMDGADVVFVREGDRYEARPVRLGARDAAQVAIVDALTAGEEVVVAHSYLVKADIEKAGAAHEH